MRLLLVEDDNRLAASLTEALDRAGFAADTLHDGVEALPAALFTEYDASWNSSAICLKTPANGGAARFSWSSG